MSNIKNAFANGKAFIPFITCGYPDLDTTARAVREMVKSGADLIELGIPFSDPTAEGAVIQTANVRALESGVTTDKIFEFLKQLRGDVKIPMVFATYANVIFSYGAERFMSACRDADIGGVILFDLPFEEKGEFLPACKKYGVDLISIVAPASQDRAAMIAREAEGFVYVISNSDVEASGGEEELAAVIKTVRANTDIPCVIGFDVKPELIKKIADISDGVIAVTAVIDILNKYKTSSPERLGEYVRAMKARI